MRTIVILLLSATAALTACGEETSGPVDNPDALVEAQTSRFEINQISYIAPEMHPNNCAAPCAGAPPITMCDFAVNLGSLAILEVLTEAELIESEICDYSQTRREVRVWAVAAGEPIPETFTLYKSWGRGMGPKTVGGLGLFQVRRAGDRWFVANSVPVVINSSEPADDSRAKQMPRTVEGLSVAASAVAMSAQASCPNRARYSDDSWFDLHRGGCEPVSDDEARSGGEDGPVTDCTVASPPVCCEDDTLDCP